MHKEMRCLEDYPCQHRQYLCPLELPAEDSSLDLKDLKVCSLNRAKSTDASMSQN